MYAALFNSDGKPIEVRDADKLIARTFNRRFLKKQLPDPGDYWFVWDGSATNDKRGSGFYRISVYAPSESSRGHRQVGYVLHAADHQHFDVETAISQCTRGSRYEPDMPDNVIAIVRERVRYIDGADLETEGQNRHSIMTRPSADLARRINKLTGINATEFGNNIGGRMVPIFELVLEVEMLINDNGLGGNPRVFKDCINATVRLRHRPRLLRLQLKLGRQLAAG